MTMTSRRTLALASVFALGFVACGGEDPPTPPPTMMTNKPTITSFTANKMTVAPGETVQLTYAVTNATRVTFSAEPGGQFGSRTEASGTIESSPINANTTFTITAEGANNTTATQRVQVTVDASAVSILSFTATPNPVERGGTTTLRWSLAGAKRVRLLRGTTEILDSSTPGTSGEQAVTVDEASVGFTLIATNDTGGSDMETITVNTAEPVVIRAFRVRPQVFSGASAMIEVTWTTSNATMLTLTANGTPVPGFTGTVGTGTITVNVTDTTTFELTAQGINGPLTEVQIVGRASAEVEPNDTPMTATPLMGGGAQGEVTMGDVDYYSVVVAAGGNLTIQTSDGMGGCNFDSVVRVLDAAGDEVVANDDGGAPVNNAGSGRCSLIDPAADGAASDLPAGTYTIEVTGFDDATGAYALVVAVGTAQCGNGLIEASLMEQCDDDNTATGDGCNASCRFEILGAVTQPGDQTFTGALGQDATAAYTVTLSSAGFVAIDTFAPAAPACPSADLVIGIFGPDGLLLGVDDNDGEGACASIHPARDTFARLMPGQYTILVVTADGTPLPAYAIRIRTLAPGCGNGVVESNEVCDDGNMSDTDGCNAQCQIVYSGTLMGPPGEQTFSSAITPGSRSVYEIVLTAPGYVFAETGAPTIGTCTSTETDTVLTLTSSSGREIVSNDDAGGTRCSRIDPGARGGPLLQPARYSLTLRGYDNTTEIAAVQTRVRVVGVACGNGILEASSMEQCDDGNTMSNDGCSATCRFDGGIVGETEPNDTNAQANAIGNVRTATVTVGGGIGAMGADVDVFSFELTGPAASLTARTYQRRGEPESCPGDTEIALVDSNNRVIARNDDAGSNLCSEISMTTTGTSASMLAPGRYFLRVNEFGSNTAIPGYLLDVRVR